MVQTRSASFCYCSVPVADDSLRTPRGSLPDWVSATQRGRPRCPWRRTLARSRWLPCADRWCRTRWRSAVGSRGGPFGRGGGAVSSGGGPFGGGGGPFGSEDRAFFRGGGLFTAGGRGCRAGAGGFRGAQGRFHVLTGCSRPGPGGVGRGGGAFARGPRYGKWWTRPARFRVGRSGWSRQCCRHAAGLR